MRAPLYNDDKIIFDTMVAQGVPMKAREISALLGISSNRVQSSIQRLNNRGYIQDPRGKNHKPHVWEAIL